MLAAGFSVAPAVVLSPAAGPASRPAPADAAAVTTAGSTAQTTAGSAAPTETVPRALVGPASALVVVSTALTLVAGPLYTFTDHAATQLRARTPYISAVFPDGAP